jgi:hypothetical protein
MHGKFRDNKSADYKRRNRADVPRYGAVIQPAMRSMTSRSMPLKP